MASIINTSINLNNIDKDKIIVGKKGKYLPISITINDEVDQFGNQGPVVVSQSKEEQDKLREELKTVLDELTYAKLAERDGEIADSVKKSQITIPLSVYVG